MTLYRVLKNLTLMTVSMGSFVKYHAMVYQANTIKEFMDRVQLHWQTDNDVILRIMQKCNYLGKQMSILFTSAVYLLSSIAIVYHFSPIIFDIIVPLNESRPIKFPVDVVLFFDEKRHPIVATIIYIFWIILIGTIYSGTESLTIMICLHITSLFEVTSYYFQTAISIEITNSHIPRKCANKKNMSYLIKSVIMHKETIQWLSQSILHATNIGENMFYLLIVITVIQYMFLINLGTQYMVDGAANISISMYMSLCYTYIEFFTIILYAFGGQ
nr:PREDICTED: uncharacterized protein LOC105664145 [Megachile rotundata]